MTTPITHDQFAEIRVRAGKAPTSHAYEAIEETIVARADAVKLLAEIDRLNAECIALTNDANHWRNSMLTQRDHADRRQAVIDRLSAALSASLEYQGQMEEQLASALKDHQIQAGHIADVHEHRKAARDSIEFWHKIADERSAEILRLVGVVEERDKRIADLDAQLATATADNPICEPTAKKRPQSDPPRNGKRHVWVEEARWQQALEAERRVTAMERQQHREANNFLQRIADLEAENTKQRAALPKESIAQEEEIARLKRVRDTHMRMIEEQMATIGRLRRLLRALVNIDGDILSTRINRATWEEAQWEAEKI